MARAQKRVSRREIRLDPLMKIIVEAQGWLDQHGSKALIGVIVIVVAVVGVLVVKNMRGSANQDAMLSLAHARQMLMENREDAALTLFEEASIRFKGTQGGANALYSLAEMKLVTGQNEEALELFHRFEKQYRNEYMLNLGALSGQAAALENLQRFDEAAEVLEKLARRDKTGHLVAYAIFEAGRCWNRAGNLNKAKEYFERITEEFPDSPQKHDAERELAALKIKLEG